MLQYVRRGNSWRQLAVDSVIDDIPSSFVLQEFLTLHKMEVGTMLLTEYDEVKHYERVYRDAHEEGVAEGITKGRAEGKIEDIINLMIFLKLSFEQAVNILRIPAQDLPLYKKVDLKSSIPINSKEFSHSTPVVSSLPTSSPVCCKLVLGISFFSVGLHCNCFAVGGSRESLT